MKKAARPEKRTAAARSTSAGAPPAAPTGPRRVRLLLEERRRQILDLLEAQGRVTVDELAARFATSEVTIRADLKELAAAGALLRTHRGALVRRDNDDLSIAVKETLRHAEKVRIAVAAAAMIQDGETIILDSGTTTVEIAKQIRAMKDKSINVITHALNIAVLLFNVPHVQLIMLGGILRRESHSLFGPMAERSLEGLRAHRLFLGVDGLDPAIGLMTPHLAEAQLNTRMISVASQVVAVTDSTKLKRRNVSVIATVDQLNVLITDREAQRDVVDELRARGVEVVLV
jgi:DeoR family transcriptional regulator of aga operon